MASKYHDTLLWIEPDACGTPLEAPELASVGLLPADVRAENRQTVRLAACPSVCDWLTAGSVQHTVSPQHPLTEGQEEALALFIPLTNTGSFLELHSRTLALFHLMGWRHLSGPALAVRWLISIDHVRSVKERGQAFAACEALLPRMVKSMSIDSSRDKGRAFSHTATPLSQR